MAGFLSNAHKFGSSMVFATNPDSGQPLKNAAPISSGGGGLYGQGSEKDKVLNPKLKGINLSPVSRRKQAERFLS